MSNTPHNPTAQDRTVSEGSNTTYSYLLSEGPSPYSELPTQPTIKQRQDGIVKFKVGNAPKGSSETPGRQTPIYYIEHEHSPETILEAWKAENQSVLDNLSARSLHHRISRRGDEWTDVSYEMFGPFESLSENGGAREMGGVCPFCETEYSRHLRDHFPCDEEGDGGGDG